MKTFLSIVIFAQFIMIAFLLYYAPARYNVRHFADTSFDRMRSAVASR